MWGVGCGGWLKIVERHLRIRVRGTPTKLGLRRSRLAYSGVTLNVARPDMNNHATLGVMLYWWLEGFCPLGPCPPCYIRVRAILRVCYIRVTPL